VSTSDAVLSGIAGYADDCGMLIWAFKALYTLASNNNKVMISVSAGDTIVTAIEKHSSYSAELDLWSLKALIHLAKQPQNRLSATTARVCALVVSIIRLHCDNTEVALWSVKAVHSLAINHEDARSKLTAAGACEASIDVMNMHLTNADIAEHGCAAIYTLAFNSAVDTTKLGTAGACKAAVVALVAHGNVASVAKWALQAVSVLAVDSVNKSSLRIGAAAETIQRVAALHEANCAVQDLAQAALAQLQSGSTAHLIAPPCESLYYLICSQVCTSLLSMETASLTLAAIACTA
jgi:hypothetical protein